MPRRKDFHAHQVRKAIKILLAIMAGEPLSNANRVQLSSLRKRYEPLREADILARAVAGYAGLRDAGYRLTVCRKMDTLFRERIFDLLLRACEYNDVKLSDIDLLGIKAAVK